MKKFLLLPFLLFVGLTIAQQKASRFTDGNDDNAPRNPRMDMMNFVPNEVLLKFKDEITVPNGSRVKAADQVVYKSNMKQQITIRTSNFVPGIYLLCISDNEWFEYKGTITKE